MAGYESAETKRKHAALQSGRFGITCTFWRGTEALVVVGENKARCRAQALVRMGDWDTEVWSTPLSIYNDLTGVTRERVEAKGQHADIGEGQRGW
jgi:hypothetical protein